MPATLEAMRVLVVEDDPLTAEAIRLCLTMRWPDTDVDAVAEGATAVSHVKARTPDLVLLDLGLPDKDGFEVLQEIRTTSDVPIIVVTARAEEYALVKGLEIGADDYMVKPFTHLELLARAKAVLRRTSKRGKPETERAGIKGRRLLLDTANRRLVMGEVIIDLTADEANLLSYLLQHEGTVVSSDVLKEHVWGSTDVSDRALKAAVHRLRFKVEEDARRPTMILARRGQGYVFLPPM